MVGCIEMHPTSLTETDPAKLWQRYIQLTEAEWAIRPIWHHKE